MATISGNTMKVFCLLCSTNDKCNYNNLTYHIAQNFYGGKFDVFDALQLDRQNLTHQIIKNNTGVW